MSAPDLSAQWLGSTLYRLTWGGSGTWDVYLAGRLVATTTENAIELSIPDQAEVEVLPAGSSAEVWPLGALLSWQPSETAALYRVEQYVAAAWVAVATLPAEAVSYTTPTLEDDSPQQWRVIAIDEAGAESAALELSFLFVRRPDIPEASLSYDEVTGEATITIS